MSRRAHPGYELKDQGFRSADLCRAAAASWICELKRTSLTHPLQIAAVTAGAGFGRVGITLCPGKCDGHAMSGEWERDLAVDLDAVRNWGAAAVITLVEPKELALLKVERLGDEVLRRNMAWSISPSLMCQFRTKDLKTSGRSPAKRFARSCAVGVTCWSIAAEDSDVPVR
jgi:hypothetical protein